MSGDKLPEWLDLRSGYVSIGSVKGERCVKVAWSIVSALQRIGREAWDKRGVLGWARLEFAARRGMIAALEWRKECLERDLSAIGAMSPNEPMAVLLSGYIEDVQAALDVLREE